MRLPKVDLKKLKQKKEANFKERLEFIDRYVAWMKKVPNSEWSAQQNEIIGKKR